MTSDNNLPSLANASPFIFTGSIQRSGASTVAVLPVDSNTVVVTVEDVIRCPIGLTNLAGSQVTVQLLEPLAAGRYIFFADPWAVGGGIAVKERAHMSAETHSVREQVAAAAESGYIAGLVPRWRAATLVVLGTMGEVRPLSPPNERPRGAPWALASLEIEQVLKGAAETRRVIVIGPRYSSRHVPLVPPLKPKLRAIFFLQPAPKEGISAVPEKDREGLLFIATTADIQPPERLSTMSQVAAAMGQ